MNQGYCMTSHFDHMGILIGPTLKWNLPEYNFKIKWALEQVDQSSVLPYVK